VNSSQGGFPSTSANRDSRRIESADLNTMHPISGLVKEVGLSTWGPSEFAREGLEWDPVVFYLSRFCPK
jgi:hypothetical protein